MCEVSFVSEHIDGCPVDGVEDINTLIDAVENSEHDIDTEALADSLGLEWGWDWEDILNLIAGGELTAEELDQKIHAAL